MISTAIYNCNFRIIIVATIYSELYVDLAFTGRSHVFHPGLHSWINGGTDKMSPTVGGGPSVHSGVSGTSAWCGSFMQQPLDNDSPGPNLDNPFSHHARGSSSSTSTSSVSNNENNNLLGAHNPSQSSPHCFSSSDVKMSVPSGIGGHYGSCSPASISFKLREGINEIPCHSSSIDRTFSGHQVHDDKVTTTFAGSSNDPFPAYVYPPSLPVANQCSSTDLNDECSSSLYHSSMAVSAVSMLSRSSQQVINREAKIKVKTNSGKQSIVYNFSETI